MAPHLGDRVAAVVDDALSDDEWFSVQGHLMACDECREAVRRERHLKSSMVCGPAPMPPADLVRALADRAGVAEHVARQERRRVAAMHAAVTVGSLCASLTVLGLCLGGSSPVQGRQPVTNPARTQPPTPVVAPSTAGRVAGMIAREAGTAASIGSAAVAEDDIEARTVHITPVVSPWRTR